MRRDISLYINNQLVDLDDNSFVLFNYAYEELSSPAVVKNSYTQSISLPATPNNNKIFDHLYKLDRETVSFNPLSRIPFVIRSNDGAILQWGYTKIDKMVTKSMRCDSYNVTLYGGLGGYFYMLSADAQGNTRNLGQFYYQAVIDGVDRIFKASTLAFEIDRFCISEAWQYLENPTEDDIFGLVNFAPAYNGKPTGEFDASKGIYKSSGSVESFENIYTSKDGYGLKSGAEGYILVDLGDAKDEWQVQDLRSYLQRPVINLKRLLHAYTLEENSGQYTFRLDEESFAIAGNTWYEKGWITLPMISRDKDLSTLTLADILGGMLDPAKWLIGIAKIFGLQFVFDDMTNTITLTARKSFFSQNYNGFKWEELVDLTNLVDVTSIDIKPNTVAARYYDFSLETYGGFAKEYEERYGGRYGRQRVDTGYNFDESAKNLLEGVIYKGAADMLKADEYFVFFRRPSTLVQPSAFFKFESAKWKLYKYEGGTESSQEFAPASPNRIYEYRYSPFEDYQIDYDTFPKVQLCGEDGGAEDGFGVLLFFDKVVELPKYPMSYGSANLYFYITDDMQIMNTLAGKPCWQLSVDGIANALIRVDRLPSFRRFLYNDAGQLQATMEMGDLREIAVPPSQYSGEIYSAGHNIYNTWWQKYVTDRYNVDSKVMTCKVDLSRFQVGQHLLRQFYYFDSAVWMLNKITNHLFTTNNLTTCEFVKVQDVNNYKNGQI